MHLYKGNVTLNNVKATQTLPDVFVKNFSPNQHSANYVFPIPSFKSSSNQQITFNYTTDTVNSAINACSPHVAAQMAFLFGC